MKTSALTRNWRAVVVAAVALLFLGCAAGVGLARTFSVGSVRAAETGCSFTPTRAALVSFVGAFSRGDYRRLDSLFAELPSFQWYSSNQPGLRSTAAAKNRGTLIRYFRVRHAQRDRLRLASFTFTGNSHGFGNFTFKMKRSAADFRRGAWFGLIGKGATVCDGPKVRFIVMSLGGPDSDKPR